MRGWGACAARVALTEQNAPPVGSGGRRKRPIPASTATPAPTDFPLNDGEYGAIFE